VLSTQIERPNPPTTHLSSFLQVGHSLGAMLAAEWTWRYPGHVRHLVLASPAGVPELVEPPTSPGSGAPLRWRLFCWRLWAHGVTPFAIIRCIGPFGRWVNG